jgi:hypothetical protein
MDKSVWEQQACVSDVKKLTCISEILASVHLFMIFALFPV